MSEIEKIVHWCEPSTDTESRLGVSYCIRWEDKIWKKYLTHLKLFKCGVMAVRVAKYTALNNTC